MEPQQYQPIYGAPAEPLKHSGAGVASFIISLVAGLAMMIVLIVAGVLGASSGGALDQNDPTTMMIGFGVICDCMLFVVGAVLGIVGLFQGDRKRIFAVLGLIFNLLLVLGVGALVAIGLALGA